MFVKGKKRLHDRRKGGIAPPVAGGGQGAKKPALALSRRLACGKRYGGGVVGSVYVAGNWRLRWALLDLSLEILHGRPACIT